MTSFSDELQKIAARRGLKIMRDLIAKGDPASMARANRLAKTKGVVKPSAAGSQIKSLGRGAEGQVDLVADPKFGISARKLYDPRGIPSEKMIRRKEMVGSAMNDPSVAKFHGARQSPGGARMHFSEYVSGNGAPTGQAATAMRRQTKADTIRAARKQGYSLPQDIHADNMRFDPASGRYKTVDFMPTKRHETVNFAAGTARPTKNIGLAEDLVNPNYDPARIGTDSAGGLRRRMLGNKPAASVPTSPRAPVTAVTAVARKPKPATAVTAVKRKPVMPVTAVHRKPAVQPQRRL